MKLWKMVLLFALAGTAFLLLLPTTWKYYKDLWDKTNAVQQRAVQSTETNR